MQQSKTFLFEYQNPRTVKLAELFPSGCGGLGALKEISSVENLAQELNTSPDQEAFIVESVECYGDLKESGWPFQRKTNGELSDLLEKIKKWFDIRLYREPENLNILVNQKLNINGETYALKVEKTSCVVQGESTISIILHTKDSLSDHTAKGFDATVSTQGVLYYMTNYRGDGSCRVVTRADFGDVMKQYKPHLEQMDRILKEHMIFENSPFNLSLEHKIYQG
ncbi:hypothetical protein HYV89_02865 [Candidatus Woesearchaeota archaeon]|nr:hypothetical protein [Candidatus Woesearchaeota archaeon]